MVQEPFGRANEAEVAFELQMDACAAGSVHASVTSTDASKCRRASGRPAGLPVLGLNQQSRPKTNDELGHHTLGTPSERPRRLGVGRLVPINASGSRSGITSRLKPRRRIVAHDSRWFGQLHVQLRALVMAKNSLKNNQETPTALVARSPVGAQHQPPTRTTREPERLS